MPAATKKKPNPAGAGRKSRRLKCACASCQCTVDMDRGYRRGNLVFCNRLCASRCTIEQCYCECDSCSV
ncbi:hypothetical protein HQ590_14325 [bacterium]|nr:hypothetical protein [bacterium]